MRAMIEDLSEYQLPSIENAFLTWRKESPNIPTPADIIKIIRADMHRAKVNTWLSTPNKHEEFHNDWKNMTQEEREKFDADIAKLKRPLTGMPKGAA